MVDFYLCIYFCFPVIAIEKEWMNGGSFLGSGLFLQSHSVVMDAHCVSSMSCWNMQGLLWKTNFKTCFYTSTHLVPHKTGARHVCWKLILCLKFNLNYYFLSYYLFYVYFQLVSSYLYSWSRLSFKFIVTRGFMTWVDVFFFIETLQSFHSWQTKCII